MSCFLGAKPTKLCTNLSKTHPCLKKLNWFHAMRNLLLIHEEQGDQIRQMFAKWTFVYIGLLFENCKSSANYWATFFMVQVVFKL
jgi:hypothetical protein